MDSHLIQKMRLTRCLKPLLIKLTRMRRLRSNPMENLEKKPRKPRYVLELHPVIRAVCFEAMSWSMYANLEVPIQGAARKNGKTAGGKAQKKVKRKPQVSRKGKTKK